MNAAKTGGGFAMWGGMFSVVDCTMAHLRGKEDSLNSITSGALTGALLSIRRKFSLTFIIICFNSIIFITEGKAAMIFSGAIGGLILGLIEGVNLLINRYQSQSIVSDQSNKNHSISTNSTFVYFF
jgi:import inner membrane translocase subunit TIM17